MKVGIRELRNETKRVIAAVRAGEAVTLTSYGQPIADIVPHQRRQRWISGDVMADWLRDEQADAGLADDLAELAGDTIADL